MSAAEVAAELERRVHSMEVSWEAVGTFAADNLPTILDALRAEPSAEEVERALDAEHADVVAKGYRRSWRECPFPDDQRRRMHRALSAARSRP